MNRTPSTWPFCPVCNATPNEYCTGPGPVGPAGLHEARRALLLGPHSNPPLRRGRVTRIVGTVMGYTIVALAFVVVVAAGVALIRWILT